MPALDEARRQWGEVPRGLREHMERVSAEAAALAARWATDPELAALAGFLHDVARARPPDLLLEQAENMGLPVDPVSRAFPLLLHGAVGAAEVARAWCDLDGELLAAIRHHSTGRWEMGQLEKIVFLADKLDPRKAGPDPALTELRELAYRDLDEAVLSVIQGQVRHLMERQGMVHPAAIEAWNWLVLGRTRGRTADTG